MTGVPAATVRTRIYYGLKTMRRVMQERGLDRLRRFLETEDVECDFGPASTLMLLTSEGAAESAKSDLEAGAKFVSAGELGERIGSSYYAGAIAVMFPAFPTGKK